jgi:hypothetical protein
VRVAVTSDPEAPAALAAASADDPRRLAVADLVAQLVARVATQAGHYETAAAAATGALPAALADLARAKHAQTAALAPVARALGVPMAPIPGPPMPDPRPTWGAILGEAFQGERTLEMASRELARLTPDPALAALGARLAAGARRDGEEVRRLYLRYT